jgi:hypothetical protein
MSKTSLEVLYAVKKLDPLIGHHVVMNFLEVLVDCGLAHLIPPSRPRAPQMFEPLTESAGMIEEHETKQEDHQGCHHPHLVCNDCGAVIVAMVKAG